MKIVIGALFACALVGESAFTQAPAAVPTQPASSAGAQGSPTGELAGRWTGKASSGDEGTRITLQVFHPVSTMQIPTRALKMHRFHPAPSDLEVAHVISV